MAHSTAFETMKDKADEMSNKACGAIHVAEDAAVDCARKAQSSLDALAKAATSYVEQGQQRAQELSRTVSGKVQERPVSALLAAAGLGFLLGVILNRR
jgi:ElaB/YqjD/DUF883 family membrane-anchored ribosome-binding protein